MKTLTCVLVLGIILRFNVQALDSDLSGLRNDFESVVSSNDLLRLIQTLPYEWLPLAMDQIPGVNRQEIQDLVGIKTSQLKKIRDQIAKRLANSNPFSPLQPFESFFLRTLMTAIDILVKKMDYLKEMLVKMSQVDTANLPDRHPIDSNSTVEYLQ